VRMPGSSGIELAKTLKQERPDLNVLFMSGHAGTEAMESVDGGGSRLLLKPFKHDALLQSVRAVLDSNSGGKSVLIVDDNSQIRNLLRGVLEGEGYRVEEASDGKKALAKIKENCPDTVITDLVMPDTEGIELIQKMRQIAGNVAIIAMSGAGGRDAYLEGAKLLGADATAAKPLEIEKLLLTIRELRRARTRSQLR